MAWSTTAVAGIWVTCVAALFLAVGFSIPFWISTVSTSTGTNAKTFNTYVGVWYVMACIKGEADSCKTGAIEPEYSESNPDGKINGTSQDLIVESSQYHLGRSVWWWVVQIVTTVALGFVLLSVLILICCRCAGIHSKGFFIISAILELFGGLLSLVISILTAIGIDVWFDFIEEVEITAETFPWSVLCFGLGGLLALVAAAIIMYVTCYWYKLGKYFEGDGDSQEQQEQPMSNLSKSYDRPRKPHDRRDYDYDRRYDQSRDFSSSKKYRDTGRDYSRDYNTRDYSSRDYSTRDYSTRDYDRSNAGYDYNSYDRAYSKSNAYDNGYDRSHTRPSDNMYRPYDQYRY
ncbi:uncharacterized protein LOC123563225 [Mercenaria mercenaria]|uniref:uncharacterized protein LOC123563225 n=1 Tax=Mercenaria mercenaria TaxID=6596 RepID=UPI00234EE514|nr:uncharacterized protein LOC123563225 [Mercenaria mercenaria]